MLLSVNEVIHLTEDAGFSRMSWLLMPSARALSRAPWSASKVQTALRCPRLFHYRYVDKIPEPEVMPETRIGKAVHAALEYCLGGMLLPVALDEGGKALTAIERARYDTLCEAIPEFLTRIESMRRRRRVHRELIEFRMAVRADGTSTQFYSGDAYFRGVLDAAFLYDRDQLALVDHKSGARYVNLSIADQLEGYAVLGVAMFRSARSIRLGVHWVVDKEVEWAPSISSEHVTDQLAPKVMDNIEAAALAVQDGARVNPSSWCERCSYRSICSEGRDMRFEPVEREPDPWIHLD